MPRKKKQRLTRDEIDALLNLVSLTADDEIDCDECLALIAEFAEQELASKPFSEGLRAVAQHLTVCSECREEYEALLRALEELRE